MAAPSVSLLLHGNCQPYQLHFVVVFSFLIFSSIARIFGQKCNISRKVKFSSLLAAVIVLGLGHDCFCCLFYCPLEGYQAIYARSYESFESTLFRRYSLLKIMDFPE